MGKFVREMAFCESQRTIIQRIAEKKVHKKRVR